MTCGTLRTCKHALFVNTACQDNCVLFHVLKRGYFGDTPLIILICLLAFYRMTCVATYWLSHIFTSIMTHVRMMHSQA